MAAFDIEHIEAATFVKRVVYRHRLGSTNDLALQIVAAGEVEYPLLVLADQQVRGRGRGENQWWAGRGALTFTLLVDAAARPKRTWPQISLSTGIAVCSALLDLLPEFSVQLKWPNDVFLQSRKVCGVLVETSPAQPEALIIGIGVNVNNSLAEANEALQSTATSLADVARREWDRTEVLIKILQHLESGLRQLETDQLQLSESWRRLCMLQGRTLCVESGTQRWVGVCQGIDDQGALLLQTDSGVQRCFAGVVAKIF
jgi:BirA family biotin operon repressor/biotin-[acetyl-CoA-carboxylase] ligase